MYEYFGYFKIAVPMQGSLLLAEPYLPDPNFFRSMILLCMHDATGSLGYVLNQPTLVTLDQVVADADGLSIPIYQGGPIEQQSLHFLHCSQVLASDSEQLADNVYWGKDIEQLLVLLKTGAVTAGEVRIFAGYSGWSEGQLEEELAAYSWIVYNRLHRAHIFGSSTGCSWGSVLKEMGGKEAWIANFPLDPLLN